MAAQDWASIKQTVYIALSQGPTPYDVIPPDFEALFPQGTSYAEGRIYRDMVLLATRQQNTSLTTTAASREIDLDDMINPDGGPIIVAEGFALISPAGTTTIATGKQIPFTQTSFDWIDQFWPQQAVTMDPDDADWIGRYWALKDAHTLVFAPTPDAPAAEVYTAVITGLFQPTPISATNATTYLSRIYPELLEAAIMIFMSGALQRNYGAQSDDPAQAQSWENQYKTLLAGALLEEQRRRGQGVGWSNSAPTPMASPGRE